MADIDIAYIGVLPCGCIPNALVASPEHAADWGKELAQWPRQGLTVKQTTVGEARAMPGFLRKCECSAKADPQMRLEETGRA